MEQDLYLDCNRARREMEEYLTRRKVVPTDDVLQSIKNYDANVEHRRMGGNTFFVILGIIMLCLLAAHH